MRLFHLRGEHGKLKFFLKSSGPGGFQSTGTPVFLWRPMPGVQIRKVSGVPGAGPFGRGCAPRQPYDHGHVEGFRHHTRGSA